MASGRSNKIVGQTGEYLVAAELSRMGLISTTFTGNVPHYDVIATNEEGAHVSVQVKTSRVASWQFSITRFCEIKLDEKNKRLHLGAPKKSPVKRLVFVFVCLEDDGNDRFYVLKWERLRDLVIKDLDDHMQRHGGVRPKKWDSLHCAIKEQVLRRYLGKWETIQKMLK